MVTLTVHTPYKNMHVACSRWLKKTWRGRRPAAETLLSVRPSIAAILFIFLLLSLQNVPLFLLVPLATVPNSYLQQPNPLPLSSPREATLPSTNHGHANSSPVNGRTSSHLVAWWSGCLVSSAGHFLRVLYTCHLPLVWVKVGAGEGLSYVCAIRSPSLSRSGTRPRTLTRKFAASLLRNVCVLRGAVGRSGWGEAWCWDVLGGRAHCAAHQ